MTEAGTVFGARVETDAERQRRGRHRERESHTFSTYTPPAILKLLSLWKHTQREETESVLSKQLAQPRYSFFMAAFFSSSSLFCSASLTSSKAASL